MRGSGHLEILVGVSRVDGRLMAEAHVKPNTGLLTTGSYMAGCRLYLEITCLRTQGSERARATAIE